MGSLFGLDGLFNALGGIAGTAMQVRATEKENKRLRNFTSGQNQLDRAFQEKWNQQQQSNWQQEFDYQKYLNENQQEITARNNAKLGINPIVGAGGAMSGFSGSISPDTQAGRVPEQFVADYSGVADAFNALAQSVLANKQLKQQKDIAQDTLENQKDIAETQSETQKEVAEINAQSAKYSADTSALTSDKDRLSRESIATAERTLKDKIALMDDKTKRKLAKDSNDLQKALQKASQDWEASDKRRNALRDIEDVLLEARRNDAVKNYLNFAIVPVPVPGSTTGEVVNMTIDDALKYYQANESKFKGDTAAVREFRDTIFNGLKTFGSWF